LAAGGPLAPAGVAASAPATTLPAHAVTLARMDEARRKDWLSRWQKDIEGDARNRYCDKAMGEEIGWLTTPFLEGFYYGQLATKDPKWAGMLVDWADSWISRGVKEPDGSVGWPKAAAAGTKVDKLDDYKADSMLGEAMALRPIVLMAGEILKDPALEKKYGAKARGYIKLSEEIFEKWDKRGTWRPTKDGGMITVVLPFGIDEKTGNWTDGFAKRNDEGQGFSHPCNKANLVARWLLAMYDVTQKPLYRDRAEKWFRVMKSRMKAKDNGTFEIWNYWQPAGKWDYKPDGTTKHWVGVHPNEGYYCIDVEAIVAAHEHGIVFTSDDIDRLIATAQAGDLAPQPGGAPAKMIKRLWSALAPYSPAIQKRFEESHKPDTWGGLGLTPWYLALQAGLRDAKP
jgi:hypothetical protein